MYRAFHQGVRAPEMNAVAALLKEVNHHLELVKILLRGIQQAGKAGVIKHHFLVLR